jgi:hypothetical protein
LVEEDLADLFDHSSAHELGHTYGLCDEYNETAWNKQNTFYGFYNYLCPNGDKNNDEILDNECITEGCPASTLEPLSSLPDNYELHNFMGYAPTINTWVSKESYKHLFGEFNHSTPVPADTRVVVSGLVNVTSGEIQFDNFYTLGSGLAENEDDHTSGNYSLEITNSSNDAVYNINFDISNINIFLNGSTIDNNDSSFVFTLPFNFTSI